MKTKLFFLVAMLTAGLASAQTTAFSFQGQLNNGGAPANGNFDFQFSVFDAATNGNLVAGPVINADTTVSNGLFTTVVDFGAGAFTGPPRWLQIGVRTNGSAAGFTDLSPLEAVTAAPYAITANSASNLLGALPVAQLTGNLPASQVSGTLSAAQLPAGLVTNGQIGVTFNGAFTGNGNGLTNVNAATLTGSVPSAALTTVPAASLTGTLTPSQLPASLVSNTETGVTLSGTFIGNGNGLTNVNAASLTGSVPSAALTTVPAASLTGTLASSQLPASIVTNTETGVTLSGVFIGNGNGLTNVNAANLTGSVPSAVLTTVPAASLTGTLTPSQLPVAVVTNTETGVTLSGAFSGSGIGLTNVNAASLTGSVPSAALTAVPAASLTGTLTPSQLPASVVVNSETGVTLSGTFGGNGSGLTGLSASQLTGGVLPLAQLPAAVITNGETFITLNGTFSGFFNGNGSGLNSINAGALSGTLAGGALAGTYPNALSLINPANVIAGTILNSLSSSLTNQVGTLVVTNTGLFTNAVLTVTNNTGQGVVIAPGGVTNSGNLRVEGWLVGPTTNAGGFWITNGTLFVTNAGLSHGVIIGGNSGNITFSGTITGNGTGLTDGSGNPMGTTISNLALTVGGNDTNFVLGASNAIETALLGAGTILSNYAQAGSVILSNIVAAGGTLPTGASLTNPMLTSPLLSGPSTNVGSLWVTNGSLLVTNSTGSVAINNGNISFSGSLVGNGSLLTGVTAAAPTAGNYASAYDTTTQHTATANVFQNITLGTESQLSGWIYNPANGAFTSTQTGLYLVTYTAEAETPNGLGSSVSLQAALGGVAVAGSGVTAAFPGTGPLSLSQSFMASVTAAQVLQFQFTGDSTDVELVSPNGAPSISVNIIRLQ